MIEDTLQVTNKVCRKCKEVKVLSEFYKDNSAPDKHRYVCKTCTSYLSLIYNQKNKEKEKARNQAYKESQRGTINYTLRVLLSAAKKRSKDNNLPFDLTLEWLETMVIPHCPITLQPIDWLKEQVANGVPGPNSPSIDKIIPELGYVQSNCAIISVRANRIKSDGTIDEHLRTVQYMAAQQLRDIEF